MPLLTPAQRAQVTADLIEAAVLPRHRAALTEVLPLVAAGPDGAQSTHAAHLYQLLHSGDQALRGAVELLCRVLLGSVIPSSGPEDDPDPDPDEDGDPVAELTQDVMQLELQGDSDKAWVMLLEQPPVRRATVVFALAMLLNAQAAATGSPGPL